MMHHTSRYGVVMAVVVALAITGCAIKTPYLPISRWPVAKQAAYYQQVSPYRVVVLPFLDQRPEQERKGQTAPAMFLLLWNRRVGDYYTGDHVFGNEVVTQLTKQLADYLQAANVFTQVVPISSIPEGFAPSNTAMLQQLGRDYTADYLLTGELQHFFGSQHQEFSMFALPLYFISAFGSQESKGLPWGQTTIRFSFVEGRTGDLVSRHPLDASATLPRETDSMAEAAMTSFTNLAGQLAAELRQLPLPSAPSSGANENRQDK